MTSSAIALLRASHAGPSFAVSAVSATLAVGVGLEWWRCGLVAFAMLAGQFSVGISNDWIDADRDRAVGRTDKPIASGEVSATLARNVAVLLVVVGLALTIPLGWAATAVHAAFIGAGWAYNAGVKNTALSVVPYLSFGLLPLFVTTALPFPALAAPWAIGAGAALGVAAHFANVLPDIDDDHATGVRGLPHRLGLKVSGLVIATSLVLASFLVVLAPGVTPNAFALIGLTLSAILAAACAAITI
ncbi:MAG: UbiA family prenyltransferase, partial [Salinibacterium sp.]|nr:UbiA family prenyltransferase [Salinibacterium sp.]